MRVEDEIIKHLGINKTFPRNIGFSQKEYQKEPFQQSVDSVEEYVANVMSRRFKSDCYVALFSDKMWQNDVIDKNFQDVDATTFKSSHTDALKLYDFYVNNFNIEPRMYFSAGKGFHIITDFPEISISPEAQKFFNYLVQLITNANFELGLSADRRRITRIPYTNNIHSYVKRKKILMCVPINREWSLHKIISVAKPFNTKACGEEINIASSKEISNVLVKIDKDIQSKGIILFADVQVNSTSRTRVIMYLLKQMKLMKEPDGRHRMLHFVIVPSLVELDWVDEEIIGFCREFIKVSGTSFSRYEAYIVKTIQRTRKGPRNDYSQPWKPWNISKLTSYFSDLKSLLG